MFQISNLKKTEDKFLKSWTIKYIQTFELRPPREMTLPYWNGVGNS